MFMSDTHFVTVVCCVEGGGKLKEERWCAERCNDEVISFQYRAWKIQYAMCTVRAENLTTLLRHTDSLSTTT